ncbi:MAG TPA: carbamate kinase, partial [Solirubrobacteraceae bacterium]
ALLLLTDVPCVERDWGTAAAAPIRHATPEELDPERFAAGSMRPKLEAARRFAATGGVAGIGALGDAAAILAGEAGTRVALATHAP